MIEYDLQEGDTVVIKNEKVLKKTILSFVDEDTVQVLEVCTKTDEPIATNEYPISEIIGVQLNLIQGEKR